VKPDLYLVVNPGARHGRSRILARRYRDRLRAHGVAFRWGRSRSLDDVGTLARRAAEAGYRRIVAVGGDGTINRVLNGVLEVEAPATRPAMGVLYAGTSPDFCRYHALPTGEAEAVQVLLAGVVRSVDVCRIRHLDPSGRPRTSYFGCTTNIGLGSGVAGRSNRLRAVLGDALGTFVAALLTMAQSRPYTLRLHRDGEALLLRDVRNLTVGKNPHLASGLKLAVEIEPTDGRLFLFALSGVGRLSLLAALPRLYTGQAAHDRRFLLDRGTTVRVESPCGAPTVEFDGDPAGWSPAEIAVLPRALPLIGAA